MDKLLFWQRLSWLLLLISTVMAVFGVIQALNSIGNGFGNSFLMIAYRIVELASWVMLLILVGKVKKSINAGEAYQKERSRITFTNWMKRLRETWVFLTVIIILFVAENLFNQLFWGGVL